MLKKMFKAKFNLKNVLTVICVSGTVGIAAKFLTLLDKWLFFPAFPNVLDAAFLMFSVAFLGYYTLKR